MPARAGDARLGACGLAGFVAFAIAGAMNHTALLALVLSSLVAAVVFLGVGYAALPPWADPKHPPLVGAVVIVAAGVAGGLLAGLIF